MSRAYFFLSCFLFLACNSPQENSFVARNDSTSAALPDPEENYPDEGEYYENLSCADLENKSVILHFANEHSFMSSASGTFDTTDVLVLKGHFIDNKTEQTLVWIADYPMPSCGDGCNLVMLFSCDNVARLLMNINTGVFTKENVRDLNNDGVLEIIAESSICRMGECHSQYEIFNLADTVQHMLYTAHSYSLVEESWGDNYEGLFKKGDTINEDISQQLIDRSGNNVFSIKQVRKVSTFNGGRTIEEIRKQKIVRIDSSFVSLKK